MINNINEAGHDADDYYIGWANLVLKSVLSFVAARFQFELESESKESDTINFVVT